MFRFFRSKETVKCSSNVDNLNNVRCVASENFRNKKKKYLKGKIEDLETSRKIKKNIRDFYKGIIDFKKGYQYRTNIVKDEKGDLVTDSHSILTRWRNHFSLLLNILGVNDDRKTELHTVEPLVPEPSAFEVKLAIEKLKSQITSLDQIQAELFMAGTKTIHSEIQKLVISI